MNSFKWTVPEPPLTRKEKERKTDLDSEPTIYRFYILPSISLLFSLLYFLPWLIDPMDGLGYNLISFFWFLVAWLPLGAHLIVGTIKLIKKDIRRVYLHHFGAAFIITISYIIVVAGISKGYLVTV
jgi:hypothetical protein